MIPVKAASTTKIVYVGEEVSLSANDLGQESYNYVYFESVPSGSQLGIGSASNSIQPGFSYNKSNHVDTGDIKFRANSVGTYTFNVRWEKYQGLIGELRDPHTDIFTITIKVVERAKDAHLKSLALSDVSLQPSFHPDTTNYTADVKSMVTGMGITPVLNNANATVTVNGSSVASGDVHPLALSPGANTIHIFVTAEDKITTRSYSLEVYRNRKPTLTEATFTVEENAANGTEVGTVNGNDADSRDTLAYSITSGNNDGIFAIDDSGKITVANHNILDYESTNRYTLTVKVDDGLETASTAVTVNVQNLNDNTPVPKGFTTTIDENTTNGTVVGTVSATDVDDDTRFTYQITDGNTTNAFAINETTGEITVADETQLDYEAVMAFTLTVRVSDGLLHQTDTATINIQNVNDNEPEMQDYTFNINENVANGTEVGTVSGSDVDGDPLSYSITAGNEDGIFAIDSSSGKVTVADGSELDYEDTKSYTLTLAADDGNHTGSATVTMNVQNLNDNAPVPTGITATIDENTANGTIVGIVRAADADAGSSFTYEMTNGNGSGAFAINEATGEVTVADETQLDYEVVKAFAFTIQVSDGVHSETTTVTIDLNNVNDNQPTMGDYTFQVDENVANGTELGVVHGSDADGDPLTYSITAGNDDGIFTLDGSSGEITVTNGSLLDYEDAKQYTLTVTADDGKHTTSATVTLNVQNVNDTAPVPSGFDATIEENTANGTVVGTVSATDADGDTSLLYRITDANTAFAINESTGEVTVVDETKLDYETVQDFQLTVEVSDGVHLSTTSVTIALNNMNDNAPEMEDFSFILDEQAADGTEVGVVSGSDVDGDPLTYSITTGNADGIFAIDSSTGQISLVDASLLDAKTKPIHALSTTVSDGIHHITRETSISLLSGDATLKNLSLNHGSLHPAFDPHVQAYTVTVGHQIDQITVIPTASEANATMFVNGKAVDSGLESSNIPLNAGENEIVIEVVAQNTSMKMYTVMVQRLQSIVTTSPILEGTTGTVTDEDVGHIDDDGTLVIDLKENDEIERIILTDEQRTLLHERNATVKIIKKGVEITIPIANFKGIGMLEVFIKRLDKDIEKIPASQLAISDIYDVTVLLDGKMISQFDHEIELAFPIDQQKYPNPETMNVYYWDEDSQAWQAVRGTYEDGMVKAYTKHFTTFAVFYPKDLEKDGSDANEDELPDTSTSMFTWMLIGLILLVSGVVGFIFRKEHDLRF